MADNDCYETYVVSSYSAAAVPGMDEMDDEEGSDYYESDHP